MRLDTILIADAVSTPGDGKFYIHGGGYSRIEISGLPAPIPIGVFVRFQVEDDDEQTEHRFCITLIGPAGVPNTFPIEGEAVPPSDNAQDLLENEPQYLDVAVQIPAVAVREGLYRIQVELDGKMMREVPLPVVVVDGPPTSERPAHPRPSW
jgi:hypothetical protein